MSHPGLSSTTPADPDEPAGTGPGPRERPLGSDEPSAPVDVPPDLPNPDLGPDVPPGDPQGPDLPG